MASTALAVEEVGGAEARLQALREPELHLGRGRAEGAPGQRRTARQLGVRLGERCGGGHPQEDEDDGEAARASQPIDA